MLRFENYFCCLLNGYFIFCSYALLSVLNSHLTKKRCGFELIVPKITKAPIKFSFSHSHPSRMVTICLIGVFCEQIKKSLIFTLFTPSQSPQFTLSQSATFASTLSILAN